MTERSLVSGGDADALLPHLLAHLDRARRCDIAVAFLLDSGARLIVEHLREFLVRGGRARILVGDYLGVTEPAALHRLLDLAGDLDLRVHQSQGIGFHLKSYMFLEDDDGAGEGVAFVGSSNISAPALTTSIEWNYRVVARRDPQGFAEIRAGFERLFADYAVVRVDDDWIARYAADRGARDVREAGVAAEPPLPRPEPRGIQRAALAALERTRAEGFTAGLVVLATGLGKTWLAAFDSDRPEFSRILFVAHREEILDQALASFRRLRPAARIGRLGGGRHERDADLVFASVQTLGRADQLDRFRPDFFDYVVVDEFHHAAAATYRRVIDHFRPRFLLGLTATPDRGDGGDLLALCQENLVFQRGIADGIAGGQLCAFRYFGVPDAVDYANIPWRNARFDIDALDLALATEARARNALEQFQRRGGSRCIAFCCSQRHAEFMAGFFRSAGIAAVAVHSGRGSAPRASSLQQLERGELKVLFAVDMFNEGVDVPLVDTVLMLRPTESSIVWMQQLGRGLRVAAGKSHLVVIDYIGNHRIFLRKLEALAGLLGREEQGQGALRDLLEAIGAGRIVLPPGCAVTYDLEAHDILGALLEPSRNAALLDSFYADHIARHGRRPTALEVFHAGFSPRASAERGWCRFLERKQDLGPAPEPILDMLPALGRVEQLRPADLGHALVLSALCAFGGRARIADLAQRLPEIARRHGVTAGRLPELARDGAAIADWIGTSIIPDLIRRLRNPRHALLEFDGDVVGLASPVIDAVAAFVKEIVDWQIAELTGAGRDIVCNVQRKGAQAPILFLPSGATGDSFPRGDLDATIDGQSLVVHVRKIAINKVVANGTKTNLLPDILRRWFGPDAGKPGTGFKVWLRRRGDRLTMEPMSLARAAEREG
jgi:superfamily II DNA or RNA helicase/HKD family nuclease